MSDQESDQVRHLFDGDSGTGSDEEPSGYTIPPPPDFRPVEENYVFDQQMNVVTHDGKPAPPGSRVKVVTAFLVVIDKEGGMWAVPDPNFMDKLVAERMATDRDYLPACSQIIADVQMIKTVTNTVQNVIPNLLNAQAQFSAQQQAEASRIAQVNEALRRQGMKPGMQFPPRR